MHAFAAMRPIDALMFRAAVGDNLQKLKNLIKAGADVTVQNVKGQTVLELAQERKSEKVLQWFGADTLEEAVRMRVEAKERKKLRADNSKYATLGMP